MGDTGWKHFHNTETRNGDQEKPYAWCCVPRVCVLAATMCVGSDLTGWDWSLSDQRTATDCRSPVRIAPLAIPQREGEREGEMGGAFLGCVDGAPLPLCPLETDAAVCVHPHGAHSTQCIWEPMRTGR